MTTTARRAAAFVAPIVAGLLLVACGGGGDGGGGKAYVEPKGPAQETISISAKNFEFTPDDITAEPGIAEIELTSTGGLHDLVFDDDKVPGFLLEVESGETNTKKVDLKPGTYDFYCSITGHRAAGMEGTIKVK